MRDEREKAAHEKGLQYVGLEGFVGVIANGAGLAMTTVDIVNQVGGKPANFLDIGGGANADVMAGALEVINNDPEVQSIFINIFGGITKGDEVANGIVTALGRVQIDVADRDPPRRHQRRRGPGDPRAAPSDKLADEAHHGRGGRRPSSPSRGRSLSDMAIFVDENTKVVYQGLTGSQGRFYGLLQPRVRHPGRRRHQPEEGRHRRRGHPRLRHRRRGRRGHRRHRRRASSSPPRA